VVYVEIEFLFFINEYNISIIMVKNIAFRP
jgi:hypothetical protein